MIYALTGITGLLGRNLFLEIIKKNKNDLFKTKFILFGRNSKTKTLKVRVLEILRDELGNYIDDKSFDFNQIDKFVSENIKFIHYSLGTKNLDLSKEDLSYLKDKKIDFFLHIAALTDFRNSNLVKKNLDLINIEGTKNILDLCSSINIKEFDYISSAYVCGMTTGIISPEYINLDQDFRNHYEKTKLIAEIFVKNFCKENNINFKIFRPSTISGRLVEKEIGKTNKFDVFYAWANFFLRRKIKYLNGQGDAILTPYITNIRYQIYFKSGLNIIPADHCAKMLLNCISHSNETYFHLTSKEELSHDFYLQEMLNMMNIKGCTPVENIPLTQNKEEILYYNTVGKIFDKYINNKPIYFDLKSAEINNMTAPLITKQDFRKIMKFAINHKLGIK